jgi:glucokinase-like ROK family protein
VVENEVQAAILLSLVQSPEPLTRAGLGESLNLGRNTLSLELRRLFALGVLEEGDPDESSVGRPSRRLRVSRGAGVVAAIEIGGTSIDVGLTTLASEVLAHVAEPALLGDGPDVILGRAFELLNGLLAAEEMTATDLRAVGVGVPGPVQPDGGEAIAPPIVSGWNGYPIRATVAATFGCPVFVENDVNVMALGEHLRGAARAVDDFLFVKVGTGIGAGLMVRGQIVRGVSGGAGEIGHICIAPDSEVVCPCGNTGCLQAFAGGPGIARAAEKAVAEGRSPVLAAARAQKGSLDAVDVGAAAAAGDAAAVAIVREAGRLVGSTLAVAVNLFNPAMIVMGGGITSIGDAFLAEIRTAVYHGSLPLATRSLPIVRSELGGMVGVVGASAFASRAAVTISL